MNLIDTEPQGGQAGSSDSRRSFPVLFHLQDVSRHRTVKPTTEPVPPAPLEIPREESVSTLAITTPTPPSPVAELPLPPPAPVHASDLRLSLPAATEPVSVPPQTEPVMLAADHPRADAIEPTAVDVPPSEPSPPTPPSPRTELQRTIAERRRKAKTPAAEDWFAAHGKYIALLFVLALAGTIYIARVNRRTTPPADKQLPLEIDAGNTAQATPDYKPSATVVGESGGMAPAAAHSASPARLETVASSSPQAELFPPTAQVASSTSPASAPAAAGDLFPVQPSTERVAARADGPLAIINHTLPAQDKTSPPPASPPQSTSPASAAPSLEPSYPSTGYPVSSYPTTNPPQFSYPVTNAPQPNRPAAPAMPQQSPTWTPPNPQPSQQPPPPGVGTENRSSFALPPGPGAPPPAWSPPPPGWSPPPPGWSPQPGAPVPQFPNNYNSVPGTRNERSGSGLYQGIR